MDATSLWYMANIFPSEEAFFSFSSLIRPSLVDKAGRGYIEMEWTAVESSKEDFIGAYEATTYQGLSSMEYSTNELSDIGHLMNALRCNEDGVQPSKSRSDTQVEKVVVREGIFSVY